MWAAKSTRRPSSSTTGSSAPPSPPQRRPQARDQLLRAEGLGHVVVGAGLERAHLLRLLADRREDEDRHLAPGAELARRPRRRRRRAGRGRRSPRRGGARRRASSASRAVSAPDRLEAGVAQDHLQRAQDLRLVVADEDRGGRRRSSRLLARCAPRLLRGRPQRQLDHEVGPCPGADSAQTRPPFTSTRPRTIARPRPDPRAGGRRGAGRRARRSGRAPRPGSPGRGRRPPAQRDPAGHGADQHRPARREAHRVLEQVDEHPLELGGVGADEGEVGVEGDLDRLGRARRERRRRP